MRRPMPTIIWARRRASTCFFMNAPLPTFTSSTSASTPSASFLRHDGRRDQRDGFHRRGNIAQGVKAAVGGSQLSGLADEA